jgi:chaperonin GroES
MAEDYTNNDQEQVMGHVLDRFMSSTNIAESLDETTLTEIGGDVVDWTEEDDRSREEWKTRKDKWIKLASQLVEKKDTPWPNAANVKYPLLETATLQFHARALPALINGNNLVLNKVNGEDPNGSKRLRATRVSQFMSYQLLCNMEEWQDDLDRSMLLLPLVGNVFKKTYYSHSQGRNVSELVPAKDLIINYHAFTFEQARKAHVIYLSKNEIYERMRSGEFITVDLEDPEEHSEDHDLRDRLEGRSPGSSGYDTPHKLYECHCWLDLDEDGYKEPYIVTVDADSGQVLRITARWYTDGVTLTPDGDIAKITPIEYFTNYIFIPSPESKIYGLGLGDLVGPLNEAANTILNQLIDAGTLSNMQGGFLSKGIRTPGRTIRTSPGVWHQLNTTADDLRKGILPYPIKDPSNVLFSLLGFIIESGEKLTTVTDMMTGQNPGQNQPFSTTMTVLEQGMKFFSSIFRRIHRSMGSEFRKLYDLNRVFLEDEEYFNYLDTNIPGISGRADFEGNSQDITPAADPNIVSETQKQMKAESLLQKIAAGMPLNIQEVTRRVLEAEGHDNVELLMQVPEPQPSFEVQLEMQKFEWQQQRESIQLELDAMKIQHQAMRDKAAAYATLAKAEQQDDMLKLDEYKAEEDAFLKREQALLDRMKVLGDLAIKNRGKSKKEAE